MPRILLIDNYDSYTHNLAHLIARVHGELPLVVKNDALDVDAALALEPALVVISPGPGRPDVARDVGVGRALLEVLARRPLPVLGVCLGHQLIGHCFGARVARAAHPLHGRTSAVRLVGDDPLFAGVPDGFTAMRYHSLSLEAPLPEALRVTARSDDGEIMAVRHRALPFHGVQFHPESVASEHGERLIANMLSIAGIGRRPVGAMRRERARQQQQQRHLAAQPLQTPLTASAYLRTFAEDTPVFCVTIGDAQVVGTGAPVAAEELERAVAEHHDSTPIWHGPAQPFASGFVGSFDYESATPTLLRVGAAVVFHADGRVVCVAAGDDEAQALQMLAALAGSIEQATQTIAPRSDWSTKGAFVDSAADYKAKVARCQELIVAGEAYELCLTTRFEGATTAHPLDLFDALRSANPAPFSGFFRSGTRSLVCASPELLMRHDGDGRAATRPIKGTRGRGATPEQDAAIARELAHADKDRAENLMIVDVSRHDLGQVALPGCVSTPTLLQVETHPTVFQLVSEVVAETRASALATAQALLPPASMTGAPKRRAVEWLAELEQRPRGVYAGAFGWIDDRGHAELAVVIRSAELERSAADAGEYQLRFGVGGAVLLDSNPDAEWAEAMLKAKAMLAALRVRAPLKL